jgi:NAD/NADP transhydrogenase beta subunit
MQTVTHLALVVVVLLVATVGPAAAQGKPIKIGEINSYSGLATSTPSPTGKAS